MTFLVPCQHQTAEAYTEGVAHTSTRIIDVMSENAKDNSAGEICSAHLTDVLDQVMVYHLKLFAQQVSKEAAQEWLQDTLARMQYHGVNVLERY